VCIFRLVRCGVGMKRCCILYAPMLGVGGRGWVVFVGFVSLTFLLNLRNFLFPARGLSASRVLLCVRRFGAFGFLWGEYKCVKCRNE